MALSFPGFYSQTAAGVMFTGTSTAPKTGILIPIADTTSPTFGLWNPAGSGYTATLVRFSASFVGTTGAPGGILYNALYNAGSAIATGAPISAFNTVAPTNNYLGGGLATNMRFCPAGTTTLTTAGTTIGQMGISQLTTTGATTSAPAYMVADDFNGRIIVGPGVFFYITGSAALLSLFNLTLSWFETKIGNQIN